jgi:hypothetical protein
MPGMRIRRLEGTWGARVRELGTKDRSETVAELDSVFTQGCGGILVGPRWDVIVDSPSGKT